MRLPPGRRPSVSAAPSFCVEIADAIEQDDPAAVPAALARILNQIVGD
jgi:hypothetical protein